jgi:hypothetical protein
MTSPRFEVVLSLIGLNSGFAGLLDHPPVAKRDTGLTRRRELRAYVMSSPIQRNPAHYILVDAEETRRVSDACGRRPGELIHGVRGTVAAI